MYLHRGTDYLAAQIVPIGTRNHSVHSVNSVSLLRDVDHEAHIEKHQRRGEKQAIEKIECAADSREQISLVFYVGAALDDRFGQIAEDCSKPQ